MFTSFDKAAAAALAGALVVIVNNFYPMTPEVQGAVTTVVLFVVTYLVPNKTKK